MPKAIVTMAHGQTGLWSALIEWPNGYRFVSGLTVWDVRHRARVVCDALGRVAVWS